MFPARHKTNFRRASVEEVLADGARGVFMLMYELVQDVEEQTDGREVSLTPTFETISTMPETESVVTLDEEGLKEETQEKSDEETSKQMPTSERIDTWLMADMVSGDIESEEAINDDESLPISTPLPEPIAT
jgi:hypothetical protein